MGRMVPRNGTQGGHANDPGLGFVMNTVVHGSATATRTETDEGRLIMD
jgi:hypothetical protein